jgi:hypothetical protein
MSRDPKEILASTTQQVRDVVTNMLEVEREYQHFQDLKAAKKLEEVKSRLINIIREEVK